MPKITPGKLVERVYREGRAYHDGRRYVGFEGAPAKTQIPTPQWELDPKGNSPEPQARQDQRAPTYDNNTKETWLTGHGKHPSSDYKPEGEPTRKK
jgi:hypothetical protein